MADRATPAKEDIAEERELILQRPRRTAVRATGRVEQRALRGQVVGRAINHKADEPTQECEEKELHRLTKSYAEIMMPTC